MKWLLTIVLTVSLLGCEPECDDCEECDTSLSELQAVLVAATEDGEVVTIDGIEGDDVAFDGVVGVLPVRETRSALATCPALGLPSPTYDWFCEESNANGRVIAVDDASPTIDSFQVYDEYPSVAYPDPMTSRVFFSQAIYARHWGGPYQAMRGIVQSWSAAWGNARVDWCNHPVHGERCVQE